MTEQQIPHSGTLSEHLREQPVRDFDKTTLPEAYERGHLVTPDSPAPLLERPGTEAKKNKKGLTIGLGAGAAGLAIAAGAVLGVNALHQPPKPQPAAAAPAHPSETPSEPVPATTPGTSNETEPLTVEKLAIPAGLDTETLGKTIIEDRISEWLNAGASSDLRTARFDANQTWGEFLPTVADKNEAVFAEALYMPGWQSIKNLADDVANTRNTNLAVLQTYVSTAWSGDEKPQNKEGFRSWMTVDHVEQISDGDSDPSTRTLKIAYENHTNSDMNEGPAPGRKGGFYFISTKVVNGTEKITGISIQ